MVLAELIGVFIVALSILYIYYKFVIFNFWRKRDVFCPEPVVPTGNLKPLISGKEQLGVFFQNLYMKYKDHRAFGIYSLFKPNLIIADLDLIRTVLTKEFGSFHDRGVHCNEKVDPLTANLFALSGKKWRNLRVKLTPTFTSGKIKRMFAIMKECSEECSKFLESEAQMKNSIDIKDIFARYSTDIIMSVAFGVKSNCIEEPNNEYRIYGKKTAHLHPLWAAMDLYVPELMDLFSIPTIDRQITNYYMKMFRENVKYRQSHNVVRHDVVDLLIQLMEKGYVEPDDKKDANNESSTTSKLTMEEATAQSFVFFLAGFETSSATATLALLELAQHRDIQDKLCREIDEILAKHGNLTYDAVNEMTYLHKVVNETLRKFPPVPILIRVTTQEIELPTTNIRLPKGTGITIPVLGIHRDPSIYPDPDKFDPERFNTDVVAERHSYAFIPFGEGPRVCIGSRFALAQTKVGMVSLLSKYKFSLHPRTQLPITFDTNSSILVVKGGVHLIIEPR